jgi:hypothetical protein
VIWCRKRSFNFGRRSTGIGSPVIPPIMLIQLLIYPLISVRDFL